MTQQHIRDALRSVYDPELGINIVDLGLVYSIEVEPGCVHIQITMTTPACPLHGVITREMERVLRKKFPDLGALTIEIVWQPLWSPEMMSDAAKHQLGWMR
jgi:metal-sulfur cluster biosynthetic enzyme